MAKLFKWLIVLFIPLFSIAITSCGGDDKDEPENPDKNQTGTTQQSIVGTWKGVWKDYTGVRDELITAYIYGDGKEGSLQIWWTHYKNLDQYYFTGYYEIKGNKLTLKGRYGKHGKTPQFDYDKTVPYTCKDDVLKFYFDCDDWILTKR